MFVFFFSCHFLMVRTHKFRLHSPPAHINHPSICSIGFAWLYCTSSWWPYLQNPIAAVGANIWYLSHLSINLLSSCICSLRITDIKLHLIIIREPFTFPRLRNWSIFTADARHQANELHCRKAQGSGTARFYLSPVTLTLVPYLSELVLAIELHFC